MSPIQKFLVRILPRKWAESMKTESQRWMMRCRCGYERSWWDTGGIRWKAAGNPRNLMKCPQCQCTTWHTTYKKEAA